jgi:hypothetical protein
MPGLPTVESETEFTSRGRRGANAIAAEQTGGVRERDGRPHAKRGATHCELLHRGVAVGRAEDVRELVEPGRRDEVRLEQPEILRYSGCRGAVRETKTHRSARPYEMST